MFNITIPLWVLLLCIGIPVFSLIALTLGLIRTKIARKHKLMQKEIDRSAPANSYNCFNTDIYKMIIDQQIDAVFLSLSTIIETEKLKLKALMGGQNFMGQISPARPLLHHLPEVNENMDVAENAESATVEIAEKIVTMATKGMTPKEIAREMGLSLSEVVLALRMNNGSHGPTALGGQLEAVA